MTGSTLTEHPPGPLGATSERHAPDCGRRATHRASLSQLVAIGSLLWLTLATGCYVPLAVRAPAIPATEMPCYFRMPMRSTAPLLNLADLTVPPPADYLLGTDDLLEISSPRLFEGDEPRVTRVRIMSNGRITLPIVGEIELAGMNLAQAQLAVEKAYSDLLEKPTVSVELVEKATIQVTVIGEVDRPGVYALPRYQNDVAHAIASAGGLSEYADEAVEIHGRIPLHNLTEDSIFGDPRPEVAEPIPAPDAASQNQTQGAEPVFVTDGEQRAELQTHAVVRPSPRQDATGPAHTGPNVYANLASWQPRQLEDVGVKAVLRIPLRGMAPTITTEDGAMIVRNRLRPTDVLLRPGDVVVVPRQRDEVFFVVGPLDETRVVNFRVQERDRQLGNAFLLPNDRDIDVVTAVAMAGYIDPIDSPKTVTVHRATEGDVPLLVKVDLIKARYDWNENIYVQAGDILYLNPDAGWWSRRTFDRIVPDLLTIPFEQGMIRWINPRRNGP